MAMSGYVDIQSVFKRELERGEILSLDTDFYERARRLLSKLRSEAATSSGLRGEALAAELRLLEETLRRLFLLRLMKELGYLWRHGRKPEVLLPKEESAIMDQLVYALSSIIGGEAVEAESLEAEAGWSEELALVAFSKPYTKLLVPGKGALGPFSRGDVAVIPKRAARELEELGVVEIVVEFTPS
ncbi:MAG TPA: hypothetical protein ENG30_00555 [Thermofilaceae archaeon]|nr:hypothetical protein [Thermofilaceae archaeon]